MNFFSSLPQIDHPHVAAAITAAEQHTSGEIRVVIARHRATDPVAAATKQFERLGMTRTTHRNGVLIFLAPRSRTFAVIGDTTVHEKCGDALWLELTAAMSGYFKRSDFTGGLVHGIERAGALLATHFPRAAGEQDQLPNDITEVD